MQSRNLNGHGDSHNSDLLQDFVTQSVPFSEEAEAAVIGAVLVNPMVFLNVGAFLCTEDFFLLRHSIIWQAFQRLTDRHEPVDYLTLVEDLRNHGQLIEIGGPAYITHLVNNTPSSAHAEAYGRLVERAAVRRRLMAVADEVKTLALDERMALDEVLNDSEKRLLGVTQQRSEGMPRVLSEALSDYWDDLEQKLSGEQQFTILPTGFRDFDLKLHGIGREEFVLVSGVPGMGKTAFVICMAMQMARLGMRVVFFSLEMSVHEIIQRMIAIETGIPLATLEQPGSYEIQKKVAAAMTAMGSWNLKLDDLQNAHPLEIQRRVRKINFEDGVDIVFLDGVWLMNGDGSDYVERSQSVADNLVTIPREFNCPLVAVHQLNAVAVEGRRDKRPLLTDVRGAQNFIQNAHRVLFIYRDDFYDELAAPGIAEIIQRKGRKKPRASAKLYFHAHTTRFSNLRESDNPQI